MLTVTTILLLCAAVTIIASAMGRCPLWAPVGLLWVIAALQVWPK